MIAFIFDREATMAKGVRKAGEFCWINILTPDPAAARAFFGTLLGWTYAEMPGMGHLVQVGSSSIGGLFDLASGQTPPGTPPHIGVMVKVDDADAMAAKVTALGGRSMAPFDIMDQGRMAVCFDPSGANFELWQPKAGPGTDVDSLALGAPGWFETMTGDEAKTRAFYATLFGWTPDIMDMGHFQYTTYKLGGEYVAGLMAIPPDDVGIIPPHWAVYFNVADVDATAGKATDLGATILVPPMDIPNVGRFCVLRSPQGVAFSTIRYNDN